MLTSSTLLLPMLFRLDGGGILDNGLGGAHREVRGGLFSQLGLTFTVLSSYNTLG